MARARDSRPCVTMIDLFLVLYVIHCDGRWVQDAIGWLPRNLNLSQYHLYSESIWPIILVYL